MILFCVHNRTIKMSTQLCELENGRIGELKNQKMRARKGNKSSNCIDILFLMNRFLSSYILLEKKPNRKRSYIAIIKYIYVENVIARTPFFSRV